LLRVDDQDGNLAIARPEDPETERQARMYAVSLNSLADAIVERTPRDYTRAREAFDLLTGHCYRRFGKEFPRLEITEPPAAVVVPPA
jgi:hypothetical protein